MNRFAAALWTAALLLAAPAHAGSVKLLLAVGDNVGDPEDPVLHFADADARRTAAVMVEVGNVAADRAYVLTDQPASAVRERFAELAGRIAELANAGNDVELVVYVSSHARAGTLHLRGTHLPLTELRQLAESTRARVRVLIIDACDSGAAARQKGGTLGPEYEVNLEQLPLSGTVVISSSGPAEPSQEWDSLGGSLFTHHLLTGLRGDADADGDGQVTLAEGYAYAFRRTVVEAGARAQHPSFDLDLAGAGELVLTQPGQAKSALVFPAELEGHYVLASQPRPDVVAEVDKKRGRALRLAVPPGRYALRKRLGRTTALVALDLPYGGDSVVDDRAMTKLGFDEVAVKGGFVELHPWSLSAFADASTPPYASTWGRLSGGLALRRTEGALWASLGLSGTGSSFRDSTITVTERSGALSLSAGARWLLNPLTPYAGLEVELSGYRQSFARDDQAEIQSVFGQGALPSTFTLGVGAGPVIGVDVPIFKSLFGWAQLTGLVRYLPTADASAWSLGARAAIGLGWIF